MYDGGGNGRDFSEDCTAYMFPGDPGASDDDCQYWSECISDGARTDVYAADRLFVMGMGPFTIEPGDFQQVVSDCSGHGAQTILIQFKSYSRTIPAG